MLYMVGTLCETDKLETKLPASVFTELVRGIVVLDSEYGENRNYQECGGYSLIVETAEDVQKIKTLWIMSPIPPSGSLLLARTAAISPRCIF